MERNIIASLLAFFLSSAFAGGDAQAGAARGAAVCGACHGINGISVNPQWPKLAGQGEKYLLRQLRDYRNGKRDNLIMRAQTAMLGDEEMADVAAYFATRKPFAATQKEKTEPLEPGKTLYRQGDPQVGLPACASCHGANGAGKVASALPRLAGQHGAYIRDQLHKFRNAARKEKKRPPDRLRDNDPNGTMRAVAALLSDARIDALAAYIEGMR